MTTALARSASDLHRKPQPTTAAVVRSFLSARIMFSPATHSGNDAPIRIISYARLIYIPTHPISHHMRTIQGHISSITRRAGQRLKRLARQAMRAARIVLKRMQGGVRHRHVEEVRDCASAMTARCHASTATHRRGLPGGKTLSLSAEATDPVSRASVWAKPSFRHQACSPRACFGRAGAIGHDDLQAPSAFVAMRPAPLFRL